MSIIEDIIAEIKIEIDPVVAEAKALAGKAIDYLKDVPIMAVQKAVAFIKETSFGTKIANLVSLFTQEQFKHLTGAEKAIAIFEAAKDAYDVFMMNGALKGLIDFGVSVLRQTIQAIYDNFKATFLTKAEA